MRLFTLKAAAVLAAGTVALGTGSAFAASTPPSSSSAEPVSASPIEPAHLTVSPHAVVAGARLNIFGTCAIPTSAQSKFPTVNSISSPGFTGPARFTSTRPDAFTATAQAVSKPGTYRVTVKCSNGTTATSFVDTGTPKPAPKPEPARISVSSPRVAPGAKIHLSGTVATRQGKPVGAVKAIMSRGFASSGKAVLDKNDPTAFSAHATTVKSPGRYLVKLIGEHGAVLATTHFDVVKR
jgi:hypothetical protein